VKARETKNKVKQKTMLNSKDLKTPGIYSMENKYCKKVQTTNYYEGEFANLYMCKKVSDQQKNS
jgi:hypothetical protein